MYKFYSVEESIMRLNLVKGEDFLIQVFFTDDLRYEFIPRDRYNPLHRLRGTQSISQFLISSMRENRLAIFGYHPEYNEIYSFAPIEEVGLVCFEEVELIKGPCSRNPLPTLRFSSQVVCGSYSEYLTHFGLGDNYTNRGKVLTLVTNLAKTAKKGSLEKVHSYDPSLVEKLYHGVSRFGKNVPVLRYQGLPDIFGFTNIIKSFPDITEGEIVELFDKYDIPLTSTAQKYIRDLRKEKPPRRTPRKRKREKRGSLPVEGLDIIQYIGRHHIEKIKGNVTIYSKEFGQEIVVKNPFELVQTIRSNGDSIETVLGPKIWEEVTGQRWESKGDEEE